MDPADLGIILPSDKKKRKKRNRTKPTKVPAPTEFHTNQGSYGSQTIEDEIAN